MRAAFSIRSGLTLAGLACLSVAVLIVRSGLADDTEPSERVILMTNGRVLTGFASRNAGGWLVEQANGRVQVPIEQVNVVANNLADAYRKQRDAVVEPTPATHLALAQWCISYRLHNEARDELRKCVKLDPEHSAARKLLRRLDDMLDPPQVKTTPKDQIVLKTGDGFVVPDAESLGGLSNEAAAGYTLRIQPLLINKCGNASCHGSTTPAEKPEGFHLIPVRPGTSGHRMYTERNLAEVLRYIDIQEPGLSPLVAIPQGTHAGSPSVFSGAAGNTQIKMLRAWIKTVAQEKRTEEEELLDRPSLATKKRPSQREGRGSAADPLDDPDQPMTIAAGVGAPSGVSANEGRRATMSTRPERVAGEGESLPTARNVSRASKAATAQQALPHGERPLDASSNTTGTGSDRKSTVDARGKSLDGAEDLPSDDPFDPDIFNRRFHSRPRR